jgi:hypothetical protein
MNRTIIGVLIAAAFVAIVVYMAMGEFSTRCEVCMTFKGRSVCETALAADRQHARMQAQSSACTQITNGVSEIVACTGSQPDSVRCEE